MLEILFLRWFYRHMASTAEAKGRTRGWGFLGVAAWIVGEVTGLVASFSMGGEQLAGYGMALGGAAVAAVMAWGALAALPDVSRAPDAPLEF